MFCRQGFDEVFLVVELEVRSQSGFGLGNCAVGVQIEILVLDASPKSFHENVVDPAGLPWSVLRRAVPRDRLVEGLNTEIRAHGIGQSPRHDPAGGQVQDSHEVGGALGCR